MKTVVFDIETFPLEAYAWGPKWETSLIEIKKHIRLASFAYKVLGKNKVYAYGEPDFKTYGELVQKLWELFDYADVLIAHNGKSFDIKQSNAFFLEQGLPVPSPYKIIDTKLVAKQYFRLPSYSLNDLAHYLNLGEKEDTGGWKLWKQCMEGDGRAWAKMISYNKQDVRLLESIYVKLKPYMASHPETQYYTPGCSCPRCGGTEWMRRGHKPYAREGQRQMWACKGCNKQLPGEIVSPWPRFSALPV